MKRNKTSEEQKYKREENRSETKKNYLISNQCFHKKKKTKEKQVTTASSDLDLQILTEESQIKKRTQTPCKNKFRVC
jgi:hypothetical protein